MIINSHNTPLRTAYLNESGLSCNGIADALNTMFENPSIFRIRANQLDYQTLSKLDLLILPGNNTEHSPYPTLLPPHRLRDLKMAMGLHGLIIITICGPSYFMMEYIEYETRDRQIKQCQGAGFVKGTARQAFHAMTRQNGKPNLMNDYIQACITSPYLKGDHHILNVNGPAFHLDKTEQDMCNIIIDYKHVEGCAAFIKQIGKGLLIPLGIHPELSSENSDNNSPLSFTLHDQDRYAVLRLLSKIIIDHHSRKPWQAPPTAEFSQRFEHV